MLPYEPQRTSGQGRDILGRHEKPPVSLDPARAYPTNKALEIKTRTGSRRRFILFVPRELIRLFFSVCLVREQVAVFEFVFLFFHELKKHWPQEDYEAVDVFL